MFNYDGQHHDRYYLLASEGNKEFPNHPAYPVIISFLKKDDVICEYGCGDGSKLAYFSNGTDKLCGFDISKRVIAKASKLMPQATLFDVDMSEKFRDDLFDIAMTFYTLEHVENPQAFVDNMLRSTKRGGHVICLCPNFGSPLFPSPPTLIGAGNNFLSKVCVIIKRLLKYPSECKKPFFLNVTPVLDREFNPDYDTVSEIALEKVVDYYHEHVVYSDSFYNFSYKYLFLPLPYLIVYVLACLRIKPFIYWGPTCFFVMRKK